MKSSTSKFIVTGMSAGLSVALGILGYKAAKKEIEEDGITEKGEKCLTYAKWMAPAAIVGGFACASGYSAIKELKAEKMASAVNSLSVAPIESNSYSPSPLDFEGCGVCWTPVNENGERLITSVLYPSANNPEDCTRKVYLLKELKDAACDVCDFEFGCINYADVDSITGIDTSLFDVNYKAENNGYLMFGKIGDYSSF